MWQQHLLCASCGILCRGTDELLSTGRRIRPSLRRSSNYCTKQQAENGRDRALIQYLNGQGVLMTPCRFYFGCYIDTLCGRTLRNRMSGAAARHFFFLEKCGPCPLVLESTYLSKNAPPSAGNSQRRRWRRWRKHSVCMTNALAGACPSPQCRLRAEDFAAAPQERRAICPEERT